MRKILLLLFVALLLFGCDIEDEEIDYGVSDETDEVNLDDSNDDSNAFWTKEDFEGVVYGEIVDIVPYRGWISEKETNSKSSVSDYFEIEMDLSRMQVYNFDAVRVYFENSDESIFYIKSLSGNIYYSYDEYQEQRDTGEYTESKVGPVSGGVSGGPDQPTKMGQVEADGEYSFIVFAGYFTDAISFDAQKRDYSSGSGEVRTYDGSISFTVLGAGGGSSEDCEHYTGDDDLDDGTDCLVYESNGAFVGSSVDSVYDADDSSVSNHDFRTSWGLYPLEDYDPNDYEEFIADMEATEAFEESLS